MKIISLNGDWHYLKDPKDIGEVKGFFNLPSKFKKTHKMKIPCNWEIGGIHNYSGTVWFYKEIEPVQFSKEQDVILRFGGVDYFAKVWVNGKYIGEHEGYFQPFEFDITETIKKDVPNIIVVKVSSPKEKTGRDSWPHRKRLIKGVFSHHDVRPGSWAPKLGQSHGTGGIWNDVSLIICNKVRLSGVKVSPKLFDNYKTAELDFEIFIENTTDVQVNNSVIEVAISHWLIEGKKPTPVAAFENRLDIPGGITIFRTKAIVKNPFLWWTWDHGEQNLYAVEISMKLPAREGNNNVISSIEQRFGIREIKVDENKAWFLNGRKIFIRGTNIIPEEYLSTYSNERIKKDVELIKEANCNAVRVHAHVNRKELYDAFDEAGIAVWQDFALQWDYADTDEFLSEAVRQIRDMVNLLHNNPSVVIWCCHNEPVSTGKKIDPLLFRAVGQEDLTRAVVKSSDFHEHPYPGWFWGDYKYFFALPGKPFPSEFGAQALPEIKTLEKMFNKKDLWPPNWKEWAYHDFVYEQTFHIAGIKKGKTLREFIKNSQDYQAKLLKFAIERYRQHKWSQINGIFHFMMLEPWNAISYAVLDYFRNPKKGYFTLKRCFQPILIIALLQRRTFGSGHKIEGQFWIINDYFKDCLGSRIILSIRQNNRILAKFKEVVIDIEKDSCKEITDIVYSNTKGLGIPAKLKPGPCELYLEIFDSNGVLLSSNIEEINLEKIPKGIKRFSAKFIWE